MHHDAKYIEYPTATQPSITIPLTTLNPPRSFLPDSLRRGGWADRDLLPHCTKLVPGCLLCPSCPGAQPARLWEIYNAYKSREPAIVSVMWPNEGLIQSSCFSNRQTSAMINLRVFSTMWLSCSFFLWASNGINEVFYYVGRSENAQ